MEAMLKDKICIVTGGSKGIGRGIVETFARQGGRVYYFSRSEAEDPAGLASAAAEGGGWVKWISCDVSDEAQVKAAVDGVLAESKVVDALVNNAGITRDGLVFKMKTEDWDAVIRANLTSVFLVSRAVSWAMVRNRSGSIVNITSVNGIMGAGGQTNYAASKAGIIGFTKSLAREVAPRGVRVNAIAPGFIETAMTAAIPEELREKMKAEIPMGRPGTPQDVASAALFLCSDLSTYITGEVLKVAGGICM
jgi:3-oxoacyl-[acyl-carrier protein] reductase